MLSPRSLIIVTGNYENIRKIIEIYNFLSSSFNCSFISSARGLLICTSRIENQIRYYEYKGILREIQQNTIRNKFFSKLIRVYFILKNYIKNLILV